MWGQGITVGGGRTVDSGLEMQDWDSAQSGVRGLRSEVASPTVSARREHRLQPDSYTDRQSALPCHRRLRSPFEVGVRQNIHTACIFFTPKLQNELPRQVPSAACELLPCMPTLATSRPSTRSKPCRPAATGTLTSDPPRHQRPSRPMSQHRQSLQPSPARREHLSASGGGSPRIGGVRPLSER